MPAKLPAKCSELPGTRYYINTILIIASNLQILGSLSVNTKRGMGLGSKESGPWSTPGCFLLHAFRRRRSKPLQLSLDKSDVSLIGASSPGTVNDILIFSLKQSAFVLSQQSSVTALAFSSLLSLHLGSPDLLGTLPGTPLQR